MKLQLTAWNEESDSRLGRGSDARFAPVGRGRVVAVPQSTDERREAARRRRLTPARPLSPVAARRCNVTIHEQQILVVSCLLKINDHRNVNTVS